jgi:hypothetical protein
LAGFLWNGHREFSTAADAGKPLCGRCEAPNMTSQLLNDPEHWRERARIIRNLSAEMVDPVSKSLMLKIADDYEVLATSRG